MDLSIIIPVFNVEKYIIRCLDSVFKQPFTGTLEVIVVDDCSTDGSFKILADYQKTETRLKILRHEVNKSLSITRVTGMNAAIGNYIMHIDSDDWLLPDSLENLMKICKNVNCDVVVYNYQIVDELGIISAPKKKKPILTGNKHKVQHHFFGACINKIVKRHLVQKMIYGLTSYNNGEDLIYSTEILLRAKSVFVTNNCYYSYFTNSNSITNTTAASVFLQKIGPTVNVLHQLMKTYSFSPKFTANLIEYYDMLIYNTIYSEFNVGGSFEKGIIKNVLDIYSTLPLTNKQKRIRRLEKAMIDRRFALREKIINKLGIYKIRNIL